jgi:hypothetical protein
MKDADCSSRCAKARVLNHEISIKSFPNRNHPVTALVPQPIEEDFVHHYNLLVDASTRIFAEEKMVCL